MSDLILCPRCGAENPSASGFCSSCGTALDRAAKRREERKLVSVLFVDLVGFTTRSEIADPEDVRDALSLYHADARNRIERFGGTLEKFAGDAVMAVFGAPVAHSDDAERAVRAGMAVLEGLEELSRAHDLDLAARAAVNTGDAVVVVGSGPEEALAIGDVVNTAARLQTSAPAGRLIVGEETFRATRHVISYELLEPVQAKGKTEPVAAWLAERPVAGPAERPIAGTPFVGRDRELELLGSLWARTVADRRPHLVTMLGPAGIGKSRLCQELTSFVSVDAGQVLRGRCLPYGAQTGYQAFPQIIREASGIIESDSPDVARDKLQRAVEEVMPGGEAADTSRYLALLVGLDVGEGVEEPRLLLFAARRFVESTAAGRPTLLIFEDIHWAKTSELELLEYLATYVRDAPVMFVAPARPELLDMRPTWGSGLVAQTMIPLDPLANPEATALASHLVRSVREHSVDVGRLVEVAEGNPLFLEELAASIADLGDGTLPVTVREAIASRIDAMPAEARAVLLSAAVIGKTFWRNVLRAVGDFGDIDEALSMLEARDLILREGTSQLAGDAEFTFKHMLIRDVAYSTVPRATRRKAHATVARYIEETIEGSTETLAPLLAHHWKEAGEASRAIPYLLAAAEAAFRGWAQDAVIDLYSTALDLSEDEEVRREIRLQRGIALVKLVDFEPAIEELDRLLPELSGAKKLEALLARGRATLWTERDADTIATADQAVALATELGDAEAMPAALALQSQALAMRGAAGDLDRALELGEQALVEWVPGAKPYDHAEHLHLHADTVYWAGRYQRCVELSQQARALAADVHSAEALLRGGGTEALAFAALGRHEEAIRIWDELFVIAREVQGRNSRVLLNYSSLAYRELLDLDEARRRSETALELSAGESFGMPRRFAQSDLLFTDLLAGDVESAQRAWPALWADAEAATGWTKWLIYGRLTAARAEIALRAEAPESAIEWAQRSIDLARRTRRRKYEARSLSNLGEALARLGRRDEAIRELQGSVVVADELIGPPARWDARAALGRAAYALGDDNRAATAYAEAAELVETFASTLAPERARRLLQAPPISEILSLAGQKVSGR
jgi:class 3 adenylate cyclase/tetratricopeptide (TPR) repeat protein